MQIALRVLIVFYGPEHSKIQKKIQQILKKLTLYAGCPRRRNSEEVSEKSQPVDDRTNWNEWQQAGDIAFYRQPETTPREAPHSIDSPHRPFATTPARMIAIRPCRRHRRILAQLSYPYRLPAKIR